MKSKAAEMKVEDFSIFFHIFPYFSILFKHFKHLLVFVYVTHRFLSVITRRITLDVYTRCQDSLDLWIPKVLIIGRDNFYRGRAAGPPKKDPLKLRIDRLNLSVNLNLGEQFLTLTCDVKTMFFFPKYFLR